MGFANGVRCALVSALLVLAMASPAAAQYRRVDQVTGPYAGGQVGYHNPLGADYEDRLTGGVTGGGFMGFRLTPLLAMELDLASGRVELENGLGSVTTTALAARFFPMAIGSRSRFRPPVVEPTAMIAFSPLARFVGVNGETMNGVAIVVGAGARVAAGRMVFLGADLRYERIRYLSGSFEDEEVESSFAGDDFRVLVSVGFKIPMVGRR